MTRNQKRRARKCSLCARRLPKKRPFHWCKACEERGDA